MIHLDKNSNSTPDTAPAEQYMKRCLQLAQFGGSYVAPNPMVGAVIVHNNKIIGEGYHQRYGEAHAEPNAINSVKNSELLAESTLYVNLEPCSHYGKTPPCANLIIESKIPRVVIGTLDPNPKVSGRGIELMRKAGIEVITGVLEKDCRELNKRFFIFQEKKRPYILLKWAQTTDGFIDLIRKDKLQEPLEISNNITRQLTHKMRSENQSILVGTTTVLLDNPSLTVRHWTGKSPIRIALDRKGRIPFDYHLFDGNIPTLILTEKSNENGHNLEFIQIDFNHRIIEHILNVLYEKNIHSVLVEGGSQMLKSFIECGCWDEANIEISPVLISDGIKAPVLNKQPVQMKTFSGHQWLSFENK